MISNNKNEKKNNIIKYIYQINNNTRKKKKFNGWFGIIIFYELNLNWIGLNFGNIYLFIYLL